MSNQTFPRFWYESNACWGWVESIDDLIEKCNLQTDPKFGGLKNLDEFLDKSVNCKNGTFGTRREHTGKKTLRKFLNEHNVDISIKLKR